MNDQLLTALIASPVALAVLGYLYKRIMATYTKDETRELIEDKIEPLKDHADKNSATLERVETMLTDMRIAAARRREDYGRDDSRRDT